ncbi:helix-turn-helix transcriptional regulator [Streptomyces sp. N2-109]|uniref:Helix-turn-helix transcriptional regulator n=1 Tax=Streptomyces gossypii TaxID=2883101 RepID=A0ABT2JS48_9ACTN|nr:helix-turn-helix transcriptional regulator [Streptomyces gossypii]MCT2590185.1 helix-turn-helix transcriptional regulator [Streptomyces gossypii]
MTLPKTLDPYNSPRAFYGAELRRIREAAGLSQGQLGERAFCSGTYVGQFESTVRRPQPDLSRTFDEVLGSGEHLQRLCRLARKSKHPEYFADAAELERLAKTISEYAPTLVPGLLQTEEYARALTRYEAVLRAPLGGFAVMKEQLLHLVDAARTRRAIVQVLPFSAVDDAFMSSMASVMTFSDAPPVVYTEGSHAGQLIEEPTLVERYQRSYDLVRAAALSPKASRCLIDSATKDFTRS